MGKFNKGDRVRYMDKMARIKEDHGINLWGKHEYYIEFEEEGEVPPYEYAFEHELELVERNNKPPRECQCGAWAQKGFEDFHASWCRMYTDKRYERDIK